MVNFHGYIPLLEGMIQQDLVLWYPVVPRTAAKAKLKTSQEAAPRCGKAWHIPRQQTSHLNPVDFVALQMGMVMTLDQWI